MTSRRRILEAQRDRALDDLIALRSQASSGEIDTDTEARLRAHYESEAAGALRELDALDEEPTGRSSRRTWIAISGFAVVAVAIVFGLVATVVTADEDALDTTGSSAIDLESISNDQLEAVVAANPEIIPMRLALARRYVEAGDFSAALPHYLFVLERETNPEALTYLGWMTHLSGDSETGVALLEEALERAPGDPLASWFLANALYDGLGDKAGAVPYLETVVASGQAPSDVVAEARRMIEEAGS